VEISLYGVRPETHNAITQLPGSHERSLRALHLLHERGVRVKIKSPLMECTVPQFEELRALADRLVGGFVYDTGLVPANDGSDRPLAYAMRPETLERFYQRHLGDWELIQPESDSRICNAGIDTAAIDPYGNVYPCVQFRLKGGNLQEESFQTIWHDSTVLRAIRAITFSQLTDCQHCELLAYCFRCPGVVYLESGNWLGCSQIARNHAATRRKVLNLRSKVAPQMTDGAVVR